MAAASSDCRGGGVAEEKGAPVENRGTVETSLAASSQRARVGGG